MENNIETDTLAGRLNRLAASLIDCIVIAIPMLLVVWLMVSFFGFTFDVANNQVDPAIYIVTFPASFSLFFYINYKKLKNMGQTLGKEIMGSQITDIHGELLPIQSLILKRFVPFWLFPYIPIIGGVINLVNLLFIFGKPRRCIHDLIAGTKVITVNKSNQTGTS